MTTRGTAIFIEPEGSLLEALRDRKNWLEQTLPGQAFCSHPPHCTVFLGNLGPMVDWVEALRQSVGALPSFDLETDAWQQFPQDPLADGGHTVAYRVRPTAALMNVQQVVANCLAPFVQPALKPHPLAQTEPFASSLKNFGAPFVGKHWIPHFTVASPLVAPASPILTQLIAGRVHHHFRVHAVSVWRVDGEHHQRLHRLALARAKT